MLGQDTRRQLEKVYLTAVLVVRGTFRGTFRGTPQHWQPKHTKSKPTLSCAACHHPEPQLEWPLGMLDIVVP